MPLLALEPFAELAEGRAVAGGLGGRQRPERVVDVVRVLEGHGAGLLLLLNVFVV